MAAPVVTNVAGWQANPNLTPNLVKAILQHTAEVTGYSAPGRARLLNSRCAPAKFYKDKSSAADAVRRSGAKPLGQHRLTGHQPLETPGPLNHLGAAHGLGGDTTTSSGAPSADAIARLGHQRRRRRHIVGTEARWTTRLGYRLRRRQHRVGTNATTTSWGTDCGGADCDKTVWHRGRRQMCKTAEDGDNIVGTPTTTTSSGALPRQRRTWGSSRRRVVYPDDETSRCRTSR